MSRNLVTGGFGFIGAYLIKQLIEKGEEVVVFDVVSGSKPTDNVKGQFTAVLGDVRNWPQLMEIIKANKIDTIYHIGMMMPPLCEDNLWLGYQANMTGTVNVLEAARILGVGTVIYTSSIGVYSRPPAPLIANEDVIPRPVMMYGVEKVCSELIGEHYYRKHGVNFRCVRYPPIIGPGRTGTLPSAYAARVVEHAVLGRPFSLWVAPEFKIPALYVKDAARSLICLKEADESRLKRRVYNLHGFYAGGKELVDAVLKRIPKAKIDFKPDKEKMDFLSAWPERMDDTRAREEWGWKPLYDLDKYVEDAIIEMRTNEGIFR